MKSIYDKGSEFTFTLKLNNDDCKQNLVLKKDKHVYECDRGELNFKWEPLVCREMPKYRNT